MADEFMKDIEKAVEQNDNMLDGVINNGAEAREIPGTYDEAEREADQEAHERRMSDAREESDLDKAKRLIDEYSLSEFGSPADFSDLTSVGLAYTTISNPDFLKEMGVTDFNKEFEIQVEADLIKPSIITYINGDELREVGFSSLSDMNSYLENLDFNELIDIGEEHGTGWAKIAEWEVNEEAAKAIDEHEAEFGADGSRVFPHLNDEPVEKSTIYFYPEVTNEQTKELSDHLMNNRYDARLGSILGTGLSVLEVDSEQINEIQTILNDRGIRYALEDPAEVLAVSIDQLSYDFDYYNYQDALTGSREDAVNEIYSDIRSGNVGHLRDFLNEVMDSDDSASGTIAYDLLGRLNEYESSVIEESKEHPNFVLDDEFQSVYLIYDKDFNMYSHLRQPNGNLYPSSVETLGVEEAEKLASVLKSNGFKELAPDRIEERLRAVKLVDSRENELSDDEPVFPYHVVLQDDSVRQYFDYDESKDQFTQRSIPLDPNDSRSSIDFISPEEAMTRVDELKTMGYRELAPEDITKLEKEKASNLTVGDGFSLNEETTIHLIAGDVVIPGNEALVITDVVLDSDGESDFKHFAIQSLATGEVYDLRDVDLDRIGFRFNDHYPSYDRAESAELTEDEKTLMFGTPGQANEVSDRMDSIRKGEMNMNFDEFKAYLQEHIKEYLPEKYADADVSIQSVVKNNDQKLDGLMIRLEDINISPNIYINQFFEQFENGRDIDDILATIADIRTQHEVSNDFDVSKLTDFDSVKDHITCRLVNAEQNAEYLADKPHTIVEDLAVTYHVALGKEESGTMSAPITNRLMEGFGVDVEQLHKIALDNMDTLTPVSFKSMTETMIDMMLPQMMSNGMTEEDARDAITDMLPPTENEAMYVLSNEDKLNGAAMLLNDKVMDDITEKVGTDYFILPSSIHEVLIVPKTPEADLETLENMVKEVNATQVAPEERLSDHVYAYDVKEHELFRADKAEERSVAKETPIIEFPNKDEEVKVAEDEGIKVSDDLAKNIEDAIREAGGASEKKESEKISFQVSASLVTDFEDKHGAKLSRVKMPNLNRDDSSPWKSFVIGQNERTVAENGKIEVTLPASGERTVYSPSVVGNDAVTGKPIFVNDKESVPNADLKARFDALSADRTEPEKVTVSIAENLVGKPFHSDKSGKDLVAVKVPNEDKNDKERWATFLIDADKVSDGENGRKTLTLSAGASISLQRTEVIDKDSKQYRNVDAGKISVDELKKRVEPHKTNIKDMVNENSARAKEENAQNKDKANDRPKRDGNGLGD